MEEVKRIAAKLLANLNERLKEQDIYLEVNEAALSFLCERGYDATYGARPLARTIERLITKPLSEQIIQGEFSKGDRIMATLDNGRIKLENAGTATTRDSEE